MYPSRTLLSPAALLTALLLLALVGILYLFQLSAVGVLGPDEPRYSAIGHAMLQSGDYVTPRLWGSPWFEKPPLLYWMTAAGAALGRLEAMFRPERLSQVVRRKAGLFEGESALDWILRGRIAAAAGRYETALAYQA